MGLKGDVVKEYLEKFPKSTNVGLARKLLKDFPELFLNVDAARTNIRYYTGKTGKKERDKVKSNKFFGLKRKINPFRKLPEGIKQLGDWAPYEIKDKKTLIVADTHIPFHNTAALRAALEFGVEQNIDAILFLGDGIDYFSVSFWERDPRKRDIQMELNAFYAVMEEIRREFPDINIYYKIGNHDERLERYLEVKAPELLGLEYLSYASLMKAETFDINIIGDKRIIKMGKLNAVHGHEFGGSFFSPVNPARGLYLRGKENCIGGHHHQSSHHHEKTMTDDVIGTWSIGCLCDLHPKWLPINKWNHGVAVITLDGDEFQVDNRTIIKGKVY